MAEIPRVYVDNFTAALNKLSQKTREKLAEALASIDMSQDVATVREQVIDVMQAYCGGATDMAATLAAEFYDGLRELAIGERMGALAASGRVPDATEGAVRAFAQALVDGDQQAFADRCLERLDYEVKRAAAECIEYNAQRDPARPRYARVPSGSETCDFCTMLASRGPVYRTERSAGAIDHWHANCDCRVVPVFRSVAVHTGNGGVVRRGGTRIEGYDPDALYDRYIDAMGSPKFRMAVARTGGGSGKETSHPMRWAQAKRDGTVTLGSSRPRPPTRTCSSASSW